MVLQEQEHCLSDLCKGWVVTWIHVACKKKPKCARIINNSIKTAKFSTIVELLEGDFERHLLVVDGDSG